MKRAIIKFQDGEHCNIEADYLDADEKYISVHLENKIVGIFALEYVKAAYISEKGGKQQ